METQMVDNHMSIGPSLDNDFAMLDNMLMLPDHVQNSNNFDSSRQLQHVDNVTQPHTFKCKFLNISERQSDLMMNINKMIYLRN